MDYLFLFPKSKRDLRCYITQNRDKIIVYLLTKKKNYSLIPLQEDNFEVAIVVVFLNSMHNKLQALIL